MWTFKDGKLIETFTDNFEYPNTTHDGFIMYQNTHFKTKEEAINQAIIEYSSGVRILTENVSVNEEKLKKSELQLKKYQEYVEYFKSLAPVE